MATQAEIVTLTSDSLTAMTANVTDAVATLNAIATNWSAISIGTAGVPNLTGLSALYSELATAKTAITSYTAADLSGAVAAFEDLAVPNLTGYDTARWSAADTKWNAVGAGISAMLNNLATSDNLDEIITKLSNPAQRIGLSLMSKDLERKQYVLRDLYSAAESSTGARGFTYPNCITVALKLDAQQKFQFDFAQSARDVMKYITDWAKEVGQSAIQQGIAAHNSDIDFNMRYAREVVSAYSETSRTLIEQYRATLDGIFSKATHQLKEYMVNIDLLKVQADVLTADNGHIISAYTASVSEAVEKIKLAIAKEDAQVKTRVAAASAAADASAKMAGAFGSVLLANPAT